eukprot:CAMPEP_0117592570 /NCGR_PEP_ID=MMETSP0784-20121206/72144_1 /TAXON_ID=39447 /ORGANISM="" /LENGTH=45 /DNA_ID= /DNA_START= /DNA_END= /DNA_ORIENTATION=
MPCVKIKVGEMGATSGNAQTPVTKSVATTAKVAACANVMKMRRTG